jgi:hypothetical protein
MQLTESHSVLDYFLAAEKTLLEVDTETQFGPIAEVAD